MFNLRHYFGTALLLLWSPFFLHAEDISLERLMLEHALSPQVGSQLASQSSSQVSNNPATIAVATEYTKPPLRVLIDVRSNHSDGAHDFATLNKLAEKRYLDAMTFNEHDRFSIRFGLEPMPHIFGYSQEHPSLYETGLEQFFIDLKQIQQQSKLTLMAGTESTAGYYWLGIPFKNLSLHNAERHLITLGVTHEDQIKALTSYSLKHGDGNKELSLVFWFVFVFMLMFTLLRKRKRSIALLLAGSFIAFMTTWMMKPSTDTDKDFIETAQEQGLFVIWAHPGTLSGVREGPMGVQLNTPSYNREVFKTPADAFAAIYGDTDKNTVPGGLWDMFMLNYMRGYVAKPMWAVAAGDYHEEGQSREFLGNYPMDVWAKSNTEEDILAALKQGNMTSWHMGPEQNFSAHTLYLEYSEPSSKVTKKLRPGDEATVSAQVKLGIGLKEFGEQTIPIELSGHWIVDGKIKAQVSLNTSGEHVMVTSLNLPKGRHVIRFQIPAQQGVHLETNPFLVRVR